MTRILLDFDPIEQGSFLELLKNWTGEEDIQVKTQSDVERSYDIDGDSEEFDVAKKIRNSLSRAVRSFLPKVTQSH